MKVITVKDATFAVAIGKQIRTFDVCVSSEALYQLSGYQLGARHLVVSLLNS